MPDIWTAYLFHGNIADRSHLSAECLTLLLALKLAFPHRIFIASGNHECRRATSPFGFMAECDSKCGDAEGMTLFKLANQAMEALPLAHNVADRVFIVHGGLAHQPDFMISDIDTIERETSIP